jgi:hypothetical protein
MNFEDEDYVLLTGGISNKKLTKFYDIPAGNEFSNISTLFIKI